jgi:hypothetical protein
MPIAIKQYPQFFNENTWVLPISVVAVLLCWIIPLLLHDRTRGIYSSIVAIPRYGYILFGFVCLAVVVALLFGGATLFRFHSNHLTKTIAQNRALTSGRPAPSTSTPEPATRPTPPQPVLSPPAATEVPPQPSVPGKLDLIFKDSPLFTKKRRETIKQDMSGFAAYLQVLGVPIPTDIPPIGIDTTNAKATGWSFNDQRNSKYYYNKFTLQQGMLDDRRKITDAFCAFVIGRFIYKLPPPLTPYSEKQTPQQFYDATHTPEQMDNTYRWMASVQLRQYLNHSYWDQRFAKNQQPVCPDQGDGMAYYFWKIRMRFGKEFTDKLAVFTLRAVVDKPYTDPSQHYRQYFYERLRMADSVIDNENAKMPGIDAILKECAWLPN